MLYLSFLFFFLSEKDETGRETFCARWEQLPQNDDVYDDIIDNDSGDADNSSGKTLHHKCAVKLY